jgi:hypothetical protein
VSGTFTRPLLVPSKSGYASLEGGSEVSLATLTQDLEFVNPTNGHSIEIVNCYNSFKGVLAFKRPLTPGRLWKSPQAAGMS